MGQHSTLRWGVRTNEAESKDSQNSTMLKGCSGLEVCMGGRGVRGCSGQHRVTQKIIMKKRFLKKDLLLETIVLLCDYTFIM